MKTAGQILFAIGCTLLIGGIVSFFWRENVELNYYFGKINSEQGRILWLIVTFFIAVMGLIVMRSARSKSK